MDLAILRTADRDAKFWLLLILLGFLTVSWIHPLGYIGGGMDDWRYYRAAQCLLDDGNCLPRNHWQGRWPINLPLAASVALFGANRFAVGLPSLLYGLGCLILTFHLIRRMADDRTALIATGLFALIPDFTIRWLQPNIDTPELFFLLASAAFIQLYARQRNWQTACGAGLALGLALQARETAIIALPVLVIGAWRAGATNIRHWVAAGLGLALPFAAEFVVYGLWTGDPFYRRALSLDHAQIRSQNLQLEAGASTSPFFNPDYIRAWRHASGIRIHWLVDGPLNLLFNPLSGGILLASLIAAPLALPRMTERERKLCKAAAILAAYWIAAIIYAIAVNPVPRMMFPAMAATCIILALELQAFRRAKLDLTAKALVAFVIGISIVTVLGRPSTARIEPNVEAALQLYPGQIEADRNTLNQLLLMPGHDRIALLGSDRPLLLVQLLQSCESWTYRHFPGKLSAVSDLPMTPLPDRLLSSPGHMCLFRYERKIAPAAIRAARQGY